MYEYVRVEPQSLHTVIEFCSVLRNDIVPVSNLILNLRVCAYMLTYVYV